MIDYSSHYFSKLFLMLDNLIVLVEVETLAGQENIAEEKLRVRLAQIDEAMAQTGTKTIKIKKEK